MRIIGLDPGLQNTGWGIIESDGNHLRHVANGTVRSRPNDETAARLLQLFEGLLIVIAEHAPTEAAVEETFVNKNASSTLKLGLARGIALLTPARAGLPVAEYAAKVVKKSLVGGGGADKHQVAEMVRRLLPGVVTDSADSADALAVAICHAHHSATQRRWALQSGTQQRRRPPRIFPSLLAGEEGGETADSTAATRAPMTGADST